MMHGKKIELLLCVTLLAVSGCLADGPVSKSEREDEIRLTKTLDDKVEWGIRYEGMELICVKKGKNEPKCKIMGVVVNPAKAPGFQEKGIIEDKTISPKEYDKLLKQWGKEERERKKMEQKRQQEKERKDREDKKKNAKKPKPEESEDF